VPERGIYDSETVFAIGSRTMVERARRWIVLVAAKSGT
jgi:hypothetical protein